MKIAILAYSLRVAGGLSVGKNLIDKMTSYGREHEFFVFVPKGFGYENVCERDNCQSYYYAGSKTSLGRLWFEKNVLPRKILDCKPDIVLSLCNKVIKVENVKQAVLLQDSHVLYDESHYSMERVLGKLKYRYVKYNLLKNLKYVDSIFCQTPIARERFSKIFNYPLDNIKIMPNAVSELSKVDKGNIICPSVLKDKSYFNLFYLAKFYAHKNFEILIELFKKFRVELRDVRCIITITEDQHPNAPAFFRAIKDNGLEEHIICVGPLIQQELAEYFLNSDALFFPTLLESFSSTYLEAMHFGLPIITSDLDFARYICDDAALYFDPWDPVAVKNCILNIKTNSTVHEVLISKGHSRQNCFFKDWEEIARNVIDELEKLVWE